VRRETEGVVVVEAGSSSSSSTRGVEVEATADVSYPTGRPERNAIR
jgi:hypothetical protein